MNLRSEKRTKGRKRLHFFPTTRTSEKLPPEFKQSQLSEQLSRIQNVADHLADLGSVAVMPDYFVDRFVKLESFGALSEAIKKKGIEGGGGSIRGIKQLETKGGNAVNVAFSLGALGVNVSLHAIAEGFPAQLLKLMAKSYPTLEVETLGGRCGYTTAFEFTEGGRIVNVMVSDVGDLANFDGATLEDWSRIEQANIVAVLNWASNVGATSLCERAFSRKKRDAISFFDPADLTEATTRIPELKKRVIDRGLLDVISMNDNEARAVCKFLSSHLLPQDFSEQDMEAAVKKIQDHFGNTIDVHTGRFSLSCDGADSVVRAPCHRVEQKIVTGAGDAWDSADILGYLARLEPEDRLYLANAAAGLYVSRESAAPPTFQEVLNFIERQIPSSN